MPAQLLTNRLLDHASTVHEASWSATGRPPQFHPHAGGWLVGGQFSIADVAFVSSVLFSSKLLGALRCAVPRCAVLR